MGVIICAVFFDRRIGFLQKCPKMSIESVRLRKNFMACGQKRLFRAARQRQTADFMAIMTNFCHWSVFRRNTSVRSLQFPAHKDIIKAVSESAFAA